MKRAHGVLFIGKIEKWTNKGSDKQYVAASLYTVQLFISDGCTNLKKTS